MCTSVSAMYNANLRMAKILKMDLMFYSVFPEMSHVELEVQSVVHFPIDSYETGSLFTITSSSPSFH